MSLLGKQRIRVLKSWISKIKVCPEVPENLLVNHEEDSNIDICDSDRIRKMKSERQIHDTYPAEKGPKRQGNCHCLQQKIFFFFPNWMRNNQTGR